MRPLLIGTGFYSPLEKMMQRRDFFRLWLRNTSQVCNNMVVVDNSDEPGVPWEPNVRVIRCKGNLGHPGDGDAIKKPPIMGWSISWILPALVAYADGCDFIYKEQDCLAFGDWLPIVQGGGDLSFGRNSRMPCEQSLFYVRNEFIMPFINQYLSIPAHDCQMSSEDKFTRIVGAVGYHALPGGRDRPIPDTGKPFYLQRITPEELTILRGAGLI